MSNSREKAMRILLVEDIKIIQDIHVWYLKNMGCLVDVASDAEQALCLADNVYDLILLDIGLPGMNGIELFYRLKERLIHQNTKIFALTAYGDLETKRHCLRAGMEKVLHKPITQDELKAEIFE